MHHRETLDEIGPGLFTDTDMRITNSDSISPLEKRILRLEDEFWSIRTDTGELADAELSNYSAPFGGG